MPTQNLIEIIFYIIPGFVAIEVYRNFYPVKEKSDFTKVAWSIAYSIIIFTFIKWIDKKYFSNFLGSNTTNLPSLFLTMFLTLTSIVLGLFLALLHFFRFKLSLQNIFFPSFLKRIAPNGQSIWAEINNDPSNKDCWVVVFLNDNSIYLGFIKKYSFNPNFENQDFLLADTKRVDENLKTLYEVDGIGVYLNTKDVKRIEFVKGIEKGQKNV